MEEGGEVSVNGSNGRKGAINHEKWYHILLHGAEMFNKT